MGFLSSRLKKCLIVLVCISSILFGQQSDFPYRLNKKDIAVVGVGLSSKLLAKYKEDKQSLMTYEEMISLDRADINRFDIGATYNCRESLHKKSDLTRAVLAVSPSVVVLNEAMEKEWRNCFTYGAMYIEVAIVTVGFTDLAKTIAMRKRPYLYNTDISLAMKEEMIEDKDVFDSFFSGHTSSAFASAVFLSKTYMDIYGKGILSKVVWGTSIALATTTGYLRYKSGRHYPTDIIAGALVGGAIGYFVPVLHKQNPGNISFNIGSNSIGLSYSFVRPHFAQRDDWHERQ